MVGVRRLGAFRSDQDAYGQPLRPEEREKLLAPYLPERPLTASSQISASLNNGPRFHHKQRVRPAIRHILHSLIFHIIHLFFSIHIRIRQIYHALQNQAMAVLYYHHHTPELIKKDVKRLGRLPKHFSVILELPKDEVKRDGLETLIEDACEVAAWSASSGIPMLSIYERSGILKTCLPHLHRRISRTLTSYYGASAPTKPTISIRAPHLPSYSPPHSPDPPLANGTTDHAEPHHLTILLIDAGDGRQTLVDLTKTLADMSQHGKLSPADVSSDLIDAELSESVMGEPDLLVLFADRVTLDGYPPWQVRLSEIFYAQDHTRGVSYQIFLRALYKYAKAEFRLGR